jgi:hypothetical protein
MQSWLLTFLLGLPLLCPIDSGRWCFSFSSASKSYFTSVSLKFTLGNWLIAQSPLSAFGVLSLFVHWEFGSLSHFCSPAQVQCSTPPQLFVLDFSLLFMLFSFVGGGDCFNLPRVCTLLCSRGVGREVTRDAWCSLVHSGDSWKQIWNWLVGRIGTA